MPRALFSPRPLASNLPASSSKQHGCPNTLSPPPFHEPNESATFTASPTRNDTKPIKVRIVTWNMHDSLPKGDLEELFGSVPLYDPSATNPGIFPLYPQNPEHPYHLIVVAGQECPTPSGIPMGLSASFKILDKEREKPKIYDQDNGTPSSHKDNGFENGDDTHDIPTYGWTSMVEDYLCHGNGSRYSSASSPGSESPEPLKRQRSSKANRKGPYVLLVKERLMGIYMAIYIHRDLKPFIRGTSKSSVTAGLIGGRVGNKGGVGISINIAGTTFLFLNAHLAAHEGKVNNRLANLTKIKTELSVDDFLPTDDPRSTAEDLTDRFDFTFLCGDLNFRLDISRLHADWLIARQDFTQAFEFDQLNILMKQGNFLKGFCEAPIDFPPTFKYDVLRSVKHSKKARSTVADQRTDYFSTNRELEEVLDDNGDEEIEGDTLESSTKTSIISHPPIDPRNDDEACFTSATPFTINDNVASPRRNGSRLKWFPLFLPSFIPKANKRLKPRKEDIFQEPVGSLSISSDPSSPPPIGKPEIPRKLPILRPSTILVDDPGAQGTSVNDALDGEKGVYDSSAKKRVPSWCDRVLWKSTTRPSSVFSNSDSPTVRQSPRNRIGDFFAKTLGPLTPRMEIGRAPPSSEARPPKHLPLAPDTSVTATSLHLRQPIDTKQRRANTSFSPPTTAPALSYPYRHLTSPEYEAARSCAERPQTASHSIWRFLPSFLSPTHIQGHFLHHAQSSSTAFSPPIKGDVVCLSYNTLDDREMRRLEGRSDHRPVIGTYVVYT